MDNPNLYARQAGFGDMELNIKEDGLLQLIVTLADHDIRVAALNNDIQKFLSLCKEKEVFKNISGKTPAVLESIALDPEIQAIINATLGEDIGCNFLAVTFALIAVAVAVTLGIVVATAILVATATAVCGVSNISPDPSHEFVLQLWSFHGGNPDQTYILLSEYEEQQLKSVIEALQQNFPEKLKGVNIDNLKQFMALNVQKSLK